MYYTIKFFYTEKARIRCVYYTYVNILCMMYVHNIWYFLFYFVWVSPDIKYNRKDIHYQAIKYATVLVLHDIGLYVLLTLLVNPCMQDCTFLKKVATCRRITTLERYSCNTRGKHLYLERSRYGTIPTSIHTFNNF